MSAGRGNAGLVERMMTADSLRLTTCGPRKEGNTEHEQALVISGLLLRESQPRADSPGHSRRRYNSQESPEDHRSRHWRPLQGTESQRNLLYP